MAKKVNNVSILEEDDADWDWRKNLKKVYTPVQYEEYTEMATTADLGEELFNLLSLATPHGYEQYMYPLIPMDKANTLKDGRGNIIIKIGNVGTDYRTLFSCHLDTVQAGPKGRKNKGDKSIPPTIITPMITRIGAPAGEEDMVYASIVEDTEDGIVFKPSVLGADDKIGIYIMNHMIREEIPGLYIYHVGEECGGIGSHYIAEKKKDILMGITKAVAFDRMGYSDVIGSQGGNCASLKFTNALAEQLSNGLKAGVRMPFKGNVRGVWTDTASYTHLIEECTNISVGYFDQHSSGEHFDLWWLKEQLMPAILQVDWETLPVARKKSVPYVYVAPKTPYKAPVKPTFSQDKTKGVDLYTAYDKLPIWVPEDGRITGCTFDAAIRIVHKYVKCNGSFQAARDIATLIEEAELTKASLKAAENKINELTKTPLKAITYDKKKKKKKALQTRQSIFSLVGLMRSKYNNCVDSGVEFSFPKEWDRKFLDKNEILFISLRDNIKDNIVTPLIEYEQLYARYITSFHFLTSVDKPKGGDEREKHFVGMCNLITGLSELMVDTWEKDKIDELVLGF